MCTPLPMKLLKVTNVGIDHQREIKLKFKNLMVCRNWVFIVLHPRHDQILLLLLPAAIYYTYLTIILNFKVIFINYRI